MRYFVRDKVLELLQTLREAINYINNSEIEQCSFIIEDMKVVLNSLHNTFKESFSENRLLVYENILNDLEETLANVKANKEKNKRTNKEVKNTNKLISDLQIKLLDENEVKLEILFIPYKYSMWDSLESIWHATKNDPRCNSYVMPIPYYERDENGRLADFKHEIEDFIKNDIPVVSYKDFDYTMIRPDIIYYHNPYDGNNRVTSVSPEFYTDNLKHYTDMMVYVPYSMRYPLNNLSELTHARQTGVKNANKIILQSRVLKEAYISAGINKEKLLALGSPKVDAVINKLDKEEKIIIKDEKLKDFKENKVLLLNSTIGAFLRNEDYLKDLKYTMKLIVEKGMKVIWRPHPLLQATVLSMRENSAKEYELIQSFVRENPNIYHDKSSDVFFALKISDALITDPKSSIIQSYIVTKKPVYIKDNSKALKNIKYMNSDISACYFNDEIGIEKYLDLILNNRDPKENERVKKFKESIMNPNGNSGKQIHLKIVNEVLKN